MHFCGFREGELTTLKNVLVTGCSTGIGRCVADGLKERGFKVYATARKEKDVEVLKQASFEALMLNLTDSNSIKSAVDTLLDKTNGRVYGLVNNAAYGLTGAVEDLPIESLRQQFETNVFGTQELTNFIIPVMRQQNEGRIIQISSVLGFVTMKYRGAYCASKYTLESLSDAMRYELSDTNIKISLIEPGPIKSEFRNNVVTQFNKTIDKENSIHKEAYHKMEQEVGKPVPFTLGPEAVLKKVVHALESDKPKARYYVTFPTYLFALFKRILPSSLLDKILIRV